MYVHRDDVNSRTLPALGTVSDTLMTNAYCQAFCDARGFTHAGTEWSRVRPVPFTPLTYVLTNTPVGML